MKGFRCKAETEDAFLSNITFCQYRYRKIFNYYNTDTVYLFLVVVQMV